MRVLNVHTVALLALLFAAVSPLEAQVQPAPMVPIQYLDNNGRPVVAGCLFTQVSGTSTPLSSYSDYLGTVQNSNPVILDAGGRGRVFLSAAAYRLVLKTHGGINCSTGIQLWSIDGINPSANSILSSNNVWSGTNLFNAPTTFASSVTFSSGFTSSGPSFIGAGGSLVGTFAGSPSLIGMPNFLGGFLATTGSFSGQLTSTLAAGTPPFVIASSTQVNNLNVAFLQGGTWATPLSIGTGTPNIGVFTTLQVNTGFALNGSATITNILGTGVKLFSAGTVSGGAGTDVCLDGTRALTTSGCPIAPPIQQDITYCSSGCTVTGTPCTTSGASNAACTSAITWPISFADAAYSATCSGVGITGIPSVRSVSKTAGTVIVTIANGTNDGSVASTFAELDCHGGHN
jgi:hypothetical protein